MTDTALALRDAPLASPSCRALWRIAAAARRAWWSYWGCQVRRAIAMALRKLDDRTLAEIGIDRRDLEALRDDKRRNATRWHRL